MLTGDMLRRSAERFPLKPAIIWEDSMLTYQELDEAANRRHLVVDGFFKTTVKRQWLDQTYGTDRDTAVFIPRNHFRRSRWRRPIDNHGLSKR